MKLRVGYERIRGFSSPVKYSKSKASSETIKFLCDDLVKKAEKVNDWAWWALFGAMVVMEILVILKILGKI